MSATTRTARPKVMMLGLRGIPDVQGGVERHVEALAPLLVEHGFDVEVLGRAPYLPHEDVSVWRGVTVKPLWAPKRKNSETILHTGLGVLYAAWKRPDILHIHAVGPALLTPLTRLFGLKVTVTHHGYDYDRDKWSNFAKAILRAGESGGMRFSQLRIAVSAEIARTMQQRFKVPVHFLPNGVTVRDKPVRTDTLDRFGLEKRRYIMLAARLVPEKRQLDLIAGYAAMTDKTGFKLAIVGGSEHPDAYEKEVMARAAATPGVVATGFQSGEALAQLFANAALFVLPSSHEGMPIALLEALGNGLPVLASDIVANKELKLPDGDYFPLGDIEALAQALQRKLAVPFSEEDAERQIERVKRDYGWSIVADRTAALYRALMSGRPAGVLAESGDGQKA
ncbi:glycosyltransferase family 4 protein [Corticibacterium sp. UT-5YL-CI-8]|nr:glycosyltransferase family 4 protein [Tianweitania sp. UT-5YL-CI-8]